MPFSNCYGLLLNIFNVLEIILENEFFVPQKFAWNHSERSDSWMWNWNWTTKIRILILCHPCTIFTWNLSFSLFPLIPFHLGSHLPHVTLILPRPPQPLFSFLFYLASSTLQLYFYSYTHKQTSLHVYRYKMFRKFECSMKHFHFCLANRCFNLWNEMQLDWISCLDNLKDFLLGTFINCNLIISKSVYPWVLCTSNCVTFILVYTTKVSLKARNIKKNPLLTTTPQNLLMK